MANQHREASAERMLALAAELRAISRDLSMGIVAGSAPQGFKAASFVLEEGEHLASRVEDFAGRIRNEDYAPPVVYRNPEAYR